MYFVNTPVDRCISSYTAFILNWIHINDVNIGASETEMKGIEYENYVQRTYKLHFKYRKIIL